MEMEKLPRIGLGCWAIGGAFTDLGAPAGWGDVKDEISLLALETGLEMGVGLLDTANIYGAGHSERLIGKVIQGRREKVRITTKFGILCDEETKTTTGIVETPADIRGSVEASLHRLNTDYIDTLLFHCGDYPLEKVDMVLETLEELVAEGKVRDYGWSTSDVKRQGAFLKGAHCRAAEFAENVMEDDPAMRAFTASHGLIGYCRSPLAMGLLTGKYGRGTVMPDNDLRGKHAPVWMNYFLEGRPNEAFLKKLEAIREILTSQERTLAQGCIAWIWAGGENLVPIPGFKRPEQVRENVAALEKGPLRPEQVEEIRRLLEEKVS